MTALFEVLAFIAAVLGGAILFVTVTSATGAPQEAAGAAIALTVAAIPYFIAATLHRQEVRRLLQPKPADRPPL